MRQDLPTQIFPNSPSPLSSVEAQKLWLEFLQLKISPNTQHTYALSGRQAAYNADRISLIALKPCRGDKSPKSKPVG
jgi:hypothetical protein